MARIHKRTVQKNLHDPDHHDGVITHLEPDMLECRVKRALGNITKMRVLKCCTHMPANLEASSLAKGLENISFHSNPKEGQHMIHREQNRKNEASVNNYCKNKKCSHV